MLRSSVPSRVLAVLAPILILLVSLVSAPSSAVAQEQADSPVGHDVLVLVDVTGSMANDQGTGSVWSHVSASLSDLIGQLAPGTNVALVPFDAGPRLSLAYPQAEDGAAHAVAVDSAVIEEARAHVAALQTDGQGTYIYESVEFAFAQLARWRDETPGVTRVQTLVLYTDGEDNGARGGEGVAGLAALVERSRGGGTPLAFVYYDVAGQLSQTDQEHLEASDVQVVSVDSAPLVAIETPSIDLGRVDVGTSVVAELRLTSAFADVFGRRVEASVVGPEGVALASSSSTLSPTMAFELSFAAVTVPGEQQLELVLRPVDDDFVIAPRDRVVIRFEVPAPPPAPVALAEVQPEPSAKTSELSEGQHDRSGAVLEVSAAALGGLGIVFLVGVVTRTTRVKSSGTTFHRLLLRKGTEPTSLLDPEARLIVVTAEDLEQRHRYRDDGPESGPHAGLDIFLENVELITQKGVLHVRPLDGPLFVGEELVPAGGRRLRTGELIRVGELYVRYDRCEVK